MGDLGYYSLCYHYIRSADAEKMVPNLLGNTASDFAEHLKLYKENFEVIDAETAKKYSYDQDIWFTKRPGLLITFDDGLSDHYLAAQILAEANLRAIFFVPTCVLSDHLPANPIIIHYVLSLYRISGLLEAYHSILDELDLSREEFGVKNPHGKAWDVILEFKNIIYYKINYALARRILILIYERTLKKDFADPLAMMHLSDKQVREMLDMGHAIGVHSHTHPSLASSALSPEEFKSEVKFPKEYLETTFNTEVETLSYPYGKPEDCFTPEELRERGASFFLAYTVNPIKNTKTTNPLALGRYMPHSTDTASYIVSKLKSFS